jgi:hypothetical protein
MKSFQERYQQLIHRDTDTNTDRSVRNFFPWFLGAFFVLQGYYYWQYFHDRIDKVMRVLRNYHTKEQILIRPRIVAINYDHFILFLIFVFIFIMFVVFSLVAFDISQRNKVIRQLKNQLRSKKEKDE